MILNSQYVLVNTFTLALEKQRKKKIHLIPRPTRTTLGNHVASDKYKTPTNQLTEQGNK